MNLLRAKSVFISLILIIFMISLGVLYLTQTNGLATKGYQINNLKVRLAELEDQNKQLELGVAERQSIKNLSARMESLGLVQVAFTDYLSTTGSSVAVR